MTEFFQRLKQRKLVQWAVGYVAAAFALLQGIDIVAQQFGWPEDVRRGITLALVVGFFVTLGPGLVSRRTRLPASYWHRGANSRASGFVRRFPAMAICG